jgi:hypothetical protein
MKHLLLIAFLCSGTLTDMRKIGVQLGDCDLNSLSPSDFKRVTDICGQPGTIDDDNRPRCQVTVSANKATPHVAYKVLKVSPGP